MQVSQKGLYSLKALMVLARRHEEKAIKIREIAAEEELPEKFLELILLELKHARIVESVRGAKGGYRLKRQPCQIFLGEIIRTIDGPLAPFVDAEALRRLVEHDRKHSPCSTYFWRCATRLREFLTTPRSRIFPMGESRPAVNTGPRVRQANQEGMIF